MKANREVEDDQEAAVNEVLLTTPASVGKVTNFDLVAYASDVDVEAIAAADDDQQSSAGSDQSFAKKSFRIKARKKALEGQNNYGSG